MQRSSRGCEVKTYSDEYIEFYGDLYLRNLTRLSTRGILFETFLLDPYEILRAAVFSLPMPLIGDEFYPLLPDQQKAARLQMHREWMDAEIRFLTEKLTRVTPTGPKQPRRDSGRLVEPLVHHSHPNRRGQRCAFKPSKKSTIERAMELAG